MEPNLSTPAAPATAPAAPPSPAPQTAPPAPVSAPAVSGSPGTSGGTGTGGLPTPAPSVPGAAAGTPVAPPTGFNAGASPATQAANPAAVPAAVDWQARFNELNQQVQSQQHLYQLGFQAWQRAQGGNAPAAPQTPAAPEQPNVFGIPKFDHSLVQFLGRDENGQVVAKPGAPPDLVAKFTAYAEARQRAEREFFDDPMKFLGDHVANAAKKIAEEQATTRLQEYQQQQVRQQIVTQHYKDFVEHGPDGRPVWEFNPQTGGMQEKLSPAGRFYAQRANEYRSRGINDPQYLHEMAFRDLQLAIYQQQQQQLGAAQAGQQVNQQFVQNANQPGPLPTPATVTPQTAPANQPITAATINQRMAEMLRGSGINDQNLMQMMSAPSR